MRCALRCCPAAVPITSLRCVQRRRHRRLLPVRPLWYTLDWRVISNENVNSKHFSNLSHTNCQLDHHLRYHLRFLVQPISSFDVRMGMNQLKQTAHSLPFSILQTNQPAGHSSPYSLLPSCFHLQLEPFLAVGTMDNGTAR